jgi:pimeloyl-ACP methyl ester carboxylesterase
VIAMTTARRAISADGTQLAVYESGQASAPTVLAVHGFPDNHTVWDATADLLGVDYRVLRYDVRGAGASDRPSERSAYRMAHLLNDLIAVLDATHTDRVHLLGHDWGSVQCWAALTDTRLDGRVAGFTSISGPALAHARAWLGAAREHPLPAVRQLVSSYYTVLFQVPRLPELAARAGILDRALALTTRGSTASAAPHRTKADWINGLQLYRANRARAVSAASPRRIDVPVQVLVPRGDAFIRPELAMQAPLPYVTNLRTELLDGGHWLICSSPDVVAERVHAFIEEL